jgi:dipeptidyl aminopeptidase/acylaminoacyl peptidase
VGGADLADVMNVASLVRQLPWADSSQLYLFGESRGGMMVYQALRDGFPAKAAVTVGAFTDFGAIIASNPKVYDPLVRRIWSDYDQRKDELRERRSAVLWADRIKTPLLILHGGADSGLDPAHSLDLAKKLQAAGATYELHVIYGGDHSLERVAAQRDAASLAWFGRFK